MGETPSTRPLTRREAEILGFLLSRPFPGRDELLRQVDQAVVIGRCGCGCATIDLLVDPTRAGPSTVVRDAIPVEARSLRDDPPYELLLFVRDGYLESVEIVDYADEHRFGEFPPPTDFLAPWWDSASFTLRPAYSTTRAGS